MLFIYDSLLSLFRLNKFQWLKPLILFCRYLFIPANIYGPFLKFLYDSFGGMTMHMWTSPVHPCLQLDLNVAADCDMISLRLFSWSDWHVLTSLEPARMWYIILLAVFDSFSKWVTCCRDNFKRCSSIASRRGKGSLCMLYSCCV